MTEISEAMSLGTRRSHPKHRDLTELGVGGFKSFTNLTKIK
jgi:hypothetical protein